MVLRLRTGAPPSNTKTGLMPWKSSLLMRLKKPGLVSLRKYHTNQLQLKGR